MVGGGKLQSWWRNLGKEKSIKKFKLKSVRRNRNSVLVKKEKKRSWLSWLWWTLTSRRKRGKFDISSDNAMSMSHVSESEEATESCGLTAPGRNPV